MMSPSARSHRALTCGNRQTAKAFSPPLSNDDTHCKHPMLHYTRMFKEMLQKKQVPVPVMTANVALKGYHPRLPCFPRSSSVARSQHAAARQSSEQNACTFPPRWGPSSVLFSRTKASRSAPWRRPRQLLSLVKLLIFVAWSASTSFLCLVELNVPLRFSSSHYSVAHGEDQVRHPTLY